MDTRKGTGHLSAAERAKARAARKQRRLAMVEASRAKGRPVPLRVPIADEGKDDELA